jgi:hypothetical protein
MADFLQREFLTLISALGLILWISAPIVFIVEAKSWPDYDTVSGFFGLLAKSLAIGIPGYLLIEAVRYVING